MKKENQNPELKLIQFLQEAKGNVLDIFYDAYEQFMKGSESPQSFLPVIFEFTEKIGSHDEESIKVSTTIQNEVEEHLSDIKNIAIRIAKENYAPDVFYANLWNDVFISSSFSQSSEQCAVLLRMLNEDVPILPYYQALDLYCMEESEFKAALERVKQRVLESTHMLNRHFEQKTETISQLCRISKDLSQEDTYVYWATMINLIEKNNYRAGYTRAISEIKKKLSTEENE